MMRVCHKLVDPVKNIRHAFSINIQKSGRRRRSTMDKTDHLTRTSDNTRDTKIHSFTVAKVDQLSPTVKEIVLKSRENPPLLSFKAGQWVDVFIPGIQTVGGFSMTSSPQELSQKAQLRLAIKYSTHPPALWMHENCKVGDNLDLRVGGDFYWHSERVTENNKILLIAGGVGINPLSSIFNYVRDGKTDGSISKNLRAYLLFSAKSEEELLFKNSFDNYAVSDPAFHAEYFITSTAETSNTSIKGRRIQIQDLISAKKWLAQDDLNAKDVDIEAFLCGPPEMIKSIKDNLMQMNVSKINFEQWW